MENGTGIAELEDSDGDNNEELERVVKENAGSSLDGSKGSDDDDDDEVFEEAVEAKTSTTVSGISAMTKEENRELIVTLGNDDDDDVNQYEFHEAAATPTFMSEENYSDMAIERIMREANGLIDKIIAESNGGDMKDGDDVYEEIFESTSAVGETENLHGTNDESGKCDNKLNFLEALTSGDAKFADAGNTEELDLEKTGTSESSELIKAEEIDPEKLVVEKFPIITTEIQNVTPDHENLVGTLDHMHEASMEIEDRNDEKGSDSNIKSESESIEDASHEKEHYTFWGSEYEMDSVNLHQQLEEDQVVEEEKLCISDNETAEMKTIDLEVVQGDTVDTQHVDQKLSISPSSSDNSATDHGVETNVVDDSDMVKEIAEVDPQSSLPEFLVKGSSYSQPNLIDSSAEVSTEINGRTELGGNLDEKSESLSCNEKQDTMANAAEITKPAAEISSSAECATSHSTGIELNAAQLEPTPQNMNSRLSSRAGTPSTTSSSATPAGLGRAAPLLEPSSRLVQQPRANGAVSASQSQLVEVPPIGEIEEDDETREKLQMIRVKFMRLAHRFGQTPHNVVVSHVLYRLGLAEQLHWRGGGRSGAISFDLASAKAKQLEAAGQESLDFTCTIMLLGKSRVGKSATINSIFDEGCFNTDAFGMGTKKVQDIVGTVEGIRVRVIDTPGLLPSWSDQRENERILRSVKKFTKKTPPDIVLYLDRLDMLSRDFGDSPLLRTITEVFGPSIWFNAIVVLTHAASAPPEGPNGTAFSYEMFVTQRSNVVQQAIREAAGDMQLMNPISLVENHSACRKNRAGQRVLPNGQVWRPQLLLLSFASKILAEANTLLKLQDMPPGRPYASRARSPPLPFLLSSILQSRPEVKLPSDQFGDDDEGSDLEEEESEYDELPPFKPLTKAQLEKLSKLQRKAYYDELEYREKLIMEKQLQEERKRRKMMKKMQEAANSMPTDYSDNGGEESSPMPDLSLPASFDSDNPTHRYRSLDSSNPWLVRAVLEPNGWDHDIGYDGINVERLFAVNDKIPVSFSGHISKDKKDATLQMEITSSVKHGKGKATSLGFETQSVGKDYAYTLRSETRFINHRINKATAGLSATVLADVLTGGLKLEDKIIIGKRGHVLVSGGAIYGRGEFAYGGSLEATIKDKDHPLGRFLSTFGISVMNWHGDVAIGCNSQTQIPIGRHANLIGRFNINNRGSGQLSIKTNSTEQLQIVLVGLVPLVKKIMGYSQQS